MKLLGQLQPVTLFRPNHRTVILVTGAHRLAAAKLLGWENIAAVFVTGNEVELELREIAENLHRAELTALERSTQISRWVELTMANGAESAISSQPATKRRGRPASGVNAASRDLGITKDEAHRAVKVASIDEKAKKAARDAGIDSNRTALLKVARERTAEAQVAKVAEIAVAKAERKRGRANVVACSPRQIKQEITDIEVHESGRDQVPGNADAENRAYDFREALSRMNLVSVSPAEFWAVFGEGKTKTETLRWVDSALYKLRQVCTAAADSSKGMSMLLEAMTTLVDLFARLSQGALIDGATPSDVELLRMKVALADEALSLITIALDEAGKVRRDDVEMPDVPASLDRRTSKRRRRIARSN
jgi:hypothetical protein